MIGDLPAWRGERMLAWLVGRLDSACGYVDLMTHTLWAFLASRNYLVVSAAADGLTCVNGQSFLPVDGLQFSPLAAIQISPTAAR